MRIKKNAYPTSKKTLNPPVILNDLESRRLLSAILPGFGLYNPATAQLTLDYHRTGSIDVSHTLGVPGSQAVAADFNGDTLTDTAAFLNGNWSIDLNNDGSIDKTVQFGKAGDIAIAGDITGNGTAALGVYNPANGVWKFSDNQDGVKSLKYQDQPGGIPLLADWNNSGHDDLILYKSGTWTVTDPSGALITTFSLGGAPGDLPVITDFNGNHDPSPGIFNNGLWQFDTNHDGSFDATYTHGASGDDPLSGDFDPANSIFVAAGSTGSGSLGNPLGTIAAAISQATPGSIIRIAPGNYPENLVLFQTDNVDFVGAGFDAVHFDPPVKSAGTLNDALTLIRSGTTWLYNLNIASGDRGLVMEGGNVVLRGFTTNGTVNVGVLGTANEGVNCTIDAANCHFDGLTKGDALSLQNESSLTAVDCTFDGNGTDPSIAGNARQGRGLIVQLDCTAVCANCDFSNNQAVGLITTDQSFAKITASTVSFNKTFDGAIVDVQARAIFRKDIFQDNGPTRGVASGANGIEITNLFTGPPAIIKKNTFLDNTSSGIYIGNGADHQIAGNVFNNNPIGININGFIDPTISNAATINSSPLITDNFFRVPKGDPTDIGVYALGSGATGSVGGSSSAENTFKNYASGLAIYLTNYSPPTIYSEPDVTVLANIYLNSPDPVTLIDQH